MKRVNIKARSLEELENEPNIWSFTDEEKRQMVAHWKRVLQKEKRDELLDIEKKVEYLNEQLDGFYKAKQVALVKSKDIIAATTTGAAKHRSLLAAVAPKIIIAEEAGEQLRPRLACHELSIESNDGQRYRLDMSLFERLQEKDMRFPLFSLNTQRRMRPEIADFVRQCIYPKLVDGENVKEYPPVRGVRCNTFWIDHTHAEDRAHGEKTHSASNEYEVEYVVAMLRHLLNQGYAAKEVVVLCPYVGQFLKLRDRLAKEMMVFVSEKDLDLLRQEGVYDKEDSDDDGDEVENVEGDSRREAKVGKVYEAKIVLVSLVRSRANHHGGKIGFMRTHNRINVLLSRAQHGMFLVGNSAFLAANSDMWAEVVDIYHTRGQLGSGLPLRCENHPGGTAEADTPHRFEQLAPDGGCFRECGQKLPACGHVCPKRCHPEAATGHIGVFYTYHSWPQARCGDCRGSAARQYASPKHAQCRVECGKALPCRHFCKQRCDQHAGGGGGGCPPCIAKCTIMRCSHARCNHACGELCEPCQSACEWACEHRGRCELLCGVPCTRLPCDKRCERMLTCEHRCPTVCGEPCPSQQYCQVCGQDEVKGQHADLYTMEEYRNVDLDSDPVVVLACGHVFTVSTMDGQLEMASVYERDGDDGWTRLRELPSEFVNLPMCPACRSPTHSVRRYRRGYNFAALCVAEKLWISSTSSDLRDAEAAFKLAVEAVRVETNAVMARLDVTKPGYFAKEVKQKLFKLLDSQLVSFSELAERARRSPRKRAFEASVAHLLRTTPPTSADHRVAIMKRVGKATLRPYSRFERKLAALSATYRLEVALVSHRAADALKRCAVPPVFRVKTNHTKTTEEEVAITCKNFVAVRDAEVERALGESKRTLEQHGLEQAPVNEASDNELEFVVFQLRAHALNWKKKDVSTQEVQDAIRSFEADWKSRQCGIPKAVKGGDADHNACDGA
ncbi:hypothetical protein HK405_015099 [Cladochytrium tenue]|nr:hypothetical protein HK405_015099 [Cladochytrium tenue]